MEERIQKIIAARGWASRRAAEKMIASGRVTVNGLTANIGMKADPEHDEIMIEGRPVGGEEPHICVMLNKPRGYVTTCSDNRGRKTVMALLGGVRERVYPVGRLDMDSEGLLLFTNDGGLANTLMHPSNEKKKTYLVSVAGAVSEKTLETLESPIEINGKMTRAAKVCILKATDQGGVVSVTICEGRNRQVRCLCEAAELKVKRLKRVSYGEIRLGNLKSGEWRYLDEAEIKMLLCKNSCKNASR